MGVALPRHFGWSGKLDKIFTAYHSLFDAKEIIRKIFSSFLVIIFLITNGYGPATPFWVIRYARQNFLQIFWTVAYLMQKGLWKIILPFSCDNKGILKWAWSCHAPRDADRTSTVHLQTLLMYIELFCADIPSQPYINELYIVRYIISKVII